MTDAMTVFGPPGTGKTTYLMTLLEEQLRSNAPEKIAFVSFTKQGTYEGVKRAVKKFKLTTQQSRYFKTIHSLCFRALGVHRSMMIDREHYKMLSEKTGIAFTGFYTEDMTSTNDAYLHCLAMRKHNPEFAESISKELNATTLAYVEVQYNAMKDQLGIFDFDDLLTKYLEFGKPLPVEVVFIDEAQDLTPLQWKVVRMLFRNVKTAYIAGDDDQAVYEWSGADVNEFLEVKGKKMVLTQSYRMPKKVYRVAQSISRTIKNRKAKEFNPKDEMGTLKQVRGILGYNFAGGELVLARTNWILRKMSAEFATLGIPYTHKGKPSIQKMKMTAIKEHLRYEEGIIDEKDMKKYKTFFRNMQVVPWRQAINLHPEEIIHYDNVLNLDNEDMEPVKFETYHSCKGSENNNVIISLDLSAKVYDHLHHQWDAEMRCLYVAVTRSAENLTIIEPQGNRFYPLKFFV